MKRVMVVVTVGLLSLLGCTVSASAAEPWWNLNTSVRPSVIPAGGEGTIVVRASNLGNAPMAGASGVSLTLPEGVSLVEKEGVPRVRFYAFSQSRGTVDLGNALDPFGKPFGLCSLSGQRVSCQSEFPSSHFEQAPFNEPPFNEPPFKEAIENAVKEQGDVAALQPYEYIEIRVKVKDTGAAPGAQYAAEVSGGGIPPLVRSRPLPVGADAPMFGPEEYSLVPEAQGGVPSALAGSHPYQLTATFNLNQDAEEGGKDEPAGKTVVAPAVARNLAFNLPPGQIGNALATPRCSSLDFTGLAEGGLENLCPQNTVIGVAAVTIDETLNLGIQTLPVPLYNLDPAFGEPARFGFVASQSPVILDTSVRSGPGGDYGVTVSTKNTTELVNFISSTVTFWGVPGDTSHDNSRGWACLVSGYWTKESRDLPCDPMRQEKPLAFLTLPTDCAAPFASTVEGESWTDPALHPVAASFSPFSYSLQDASGGLLALGACNQLQFAPSVSAEPTSDLASAPTGLDVNVDFHDEGLTNAEGLAQSQLKDTTVTLPAGLTINPSAGVGLAGCTPADYARETVDSAPGAGCPNNSKLGTVEIETPLLAQKIQGSLFIAQPHENPFDSLVAIYVVAKNPETGVLVKLAGKVTPDPVTGQLTTTFENSPQLPFDHFNFHFREGQQAPLITPALCGTYTTSAQLTPWSNPTAALAETSPFTITKGYDGGACPSGSVPPFHPGIESGTLNNNAGSYSPFYLHLTRTDGEQEISGFSTDLPSGLTGNLSGIPFCPEADIALARTKTGAQEEAAPSCPAASQVGHTLVGTGVGAVLAYVPGKVYLAGPYHGDSFSLVSVTSAVVGPFDLGTVVIRFALKIDPNTAQVSVDPSGSEPIPHIIQGIVTHVRDIRVYVDRSNFILNPTNCNPLSISSTLNSNLGQSTTTTARFQATNCANLGFKPKFTVSTSGHTSRASGASLDAKIGFPSGALGTQANIRSVKVKLPRQLPSRLTTLQQACTDKIFNVNPAACPAASRVGTATTTTPIVPVALNGPVYFVSHGAAKFPELIIVLSGYGVTVQLHGETFISKTGITSTTFRTVPDVPVGSFELKLPQGPYSALASNGSFCKQKLLMPTRITAQNGAVITQNTKIAVSGCSKHKVGKHRRKKKK